MAWTAETDTTELSTLVGALMLPGCPEPLAEHALRQAAIDLCQRTLCWADAQTVIGTDASIDLTPSQSARIVDVLRVTWDADELIPITRASAADRLAEQATGVPEGYYRPAIDQLSLIPAPDAAGTAIITLALAPLDSASAIPSFLVLECRDALEHGALHRLLRIPNVPWAQANLSAWHRQQFEILAGAQGARSAKDGTRRPLRTATCFDF